MASLIKQPQLESTSPPYFEVYPGHSVKLFAADDTLWVTVLAVEGEELLGKVTTRDLRTRRHDLSRDDVIEFNRSNVFGLY